MLVKIQLSLFVLGLSLALSARGTEPAQSPAQSPAAAASASAAPATPPAPAAALTPAQQGAMDALKLYDGVPPLMTTDGSAATLTFATSNGRTQQVLASVGTFGFPGFPERSLSSIAATKLTAPLDPALLLRLLTNNSLGYWRVATESAGLYIYYEIDVPAKAAPDYLRAALKSIADKADALELELTQKDAH